MRDQAETKCRKLNMDMSPSQMQPTFPNSLRRQSAIKRRKGVLAPRFGRDASKRRVSNIPHMSLVDGTKLARAFRQYVKQRKMQSPTAKPCIQVSIHRKRILAREEQRRQGRISNSSMAN
jgi:hypothetical protein